VASVDVKDFSKDVKSAYEQARERSLEIIGLTAEKYAKQIVPVDTGRLRNSITHEVDGKEVYVGSATEYAASVEYGTVKQKAQPYLRPAATDHTSTYKQIIQDAFSDIK
jgi:HK97 gp10 family phage protein